MSNSSPFQIAVLRLESFLCMDLSYSGLRVWSLQGLELVSSGIQSFLWIFLASSPARSVQRVSSLEQNNGTHAMDNDPVWPVSHYWWHQNTSPPGPTNAMGSIIIQLYNTVNLLYLALLVIHSILIHCSPFDRQQIVWNVWKWYVLVYNYMKVHFLALN